MESRAGQGRECIAQRMSLCCQNQISGPRFAREAFQQEKEYASAHAYHFISTG